MKHYKKPDSSVWAFELDGSQDHLITDDMVPCAAPGGPTFAETKAALLDGVRATREQIIDRLGGISGRRQRAGDLVTSAACDAAVLKLLDLTTRPDVLAATDAAQLRTAVKTGYAEAQALLPVAVQNAFRGLDA